MNFTFATIPVVTILVYWILELVKQATNHNETVKRFLPLMATGLGMVFGVVVFYAFPSIDPADNLLFALVAGGVSGLAATGSNQIIKQLTKFGQDENQTPNDTPTTPNQENKQEQATQNKTTKSNKK